MKNFNQLLIELKRFSDYFLSIGINDIYTNSKIYEVLMAHYFNHKIINGHAHTPDAEDRFGNLYEYKHFKLSSSNHTWTFNDFSAEIIEKLNDINWVYFSVIDDSDVVPKVYKTYIVSGMDVSNYLMSATLSIQNNRRMINISESQIRNNMAYTLKSSCNYISWKELEDVFRVVNKLEEAINIHGILTSNKLWELLVGLELNHNVNSDQKKHDAIDEYGNTYEYKVSSTARWTFQDISENVLKSYLSDESIILAVVNKESFTVEKIYSCNPSTIVSILRYKLSKKIQNNEEIKRLSAGIGITDINFMLDNGDAKWVL